MMGKGNSFEVTIGHNSVFSPISKKTINPMVFFALLLLFVITNVSSRNELL